ncbi:MAG: hypothetical protein Fur0018_04870 [Anaerolineales bacterium]
MLLFLGGCVPGNSPPVPTPPWTATAPPETATPTVVWFPPTLTPTLPPTVQAVPDTPVPVGLPHGALLLHDTFQEQTSLWLSNPVAGGRITLQRNEITFTASESKTYLFSIRSQPALQDFAVQVEVSLNLCQGLDEYGLLIRSTPPNNFYRFSLSCDGQVRIDRLYNGSVTSPQPWALSGYAPRGAPGAVRLGVRAQGKTLAFYVNDVLHYTITDPSPAVGQIGLFVRNISASPLSISFRNLQIWEP